MFSNIYLIIQNIAAQLNDKRNRNVTKINNVSIVKLSFLSLFSPMNGLWDRLHSDHTNLSTWSDNKTTWKCQILFSKTIGK